MGLFEVHKSWGNGSWGNPVTGWLLGGQVMGSLIYQWSARFQSRIWFAHKARTKNDSGHGEALNPRAG